MRTFRSEIPLLFMITTLLISTILWAALKTEGSSGGSAAKEELTYWTRDETSDYMEVSIGPWHVFLVVPKTSSSGTTQTQTRSLLDLMEPLSTPCSWTQDSPGLRSCLDELSQSYEKEDTPIEELDISTSGLPTNP